MGKRYEDFRIWLEGVFEDETDVVARDKKMGGRASAIVMKGSDRWLFLHLSLTFLMTAVVDIALLFMVPEEIAGSGWFWFKEPVLVIISFWICRGFVGRLSRIFPRG